MVTHFLSESGQAACGRGDSNVNGSSDVGQVSCKTCRRTNAFAQAQENAAPASAPVTPTAAAPVIDKAAPRPKAEARPAAAQRQDRDAARKAWQARLNELSGKNRMPRSRRRAASLSLSGSGTSRRMSARGHIRPAQHNRASPHQARPCASARARPSRAPASMSGRWRGSSASSASSDNRCAAVSKAIRRRSRRRPLKRS